MPIHLTIEHGPHPGITRAELTRRTRILVLGADANQCDISFVITDDKTIHLLNKKYRGKDKPTDVLAFSMREGEFGQLDSALLGDVVVSVPTARRQAAENGCSVMDEVTMLLAHGILHLLGWDHDTPAKDRKMRAETERLCALAVAPVRRRKKRPAKKKSARKRV